jgi:hypothetical protein
VKRAGRRGYRATAAGQPAWVAAGKMGKNFLLSFSGTLIFVV